MTAIINTKFRRTMTGKSFRFLRAFSVLLFKLVVICSSRTICLVCGIEAAIKRPSRLKAECVPAVKDERINSTHFVVSLSKSDVDFEAKKEFLKSKGYLWHSSLKAWALPTIKLDRNQAGFHTKVSELKNLGYVWSKTSGLWELTFPKYQVVRVFHHKLVTQASE